MSGGGAEATPLWPTIGLALAVAAVNFLVAARSGLGLPAMLLVLVPLLWWRAARAMRAVEPMLLAAQLDVAGARAHFRRIPLGAAILCLVLGVGVPLFAHWSGFAGSVSSLKGQRTIAHATDPALFWITSASWYAISAGLLWFAALFAWMIERIRRDPRRFLELMAQR